MSRIECPECGHEFSSSGKGSTLRTLGVAGLIVAVFAAGTWALSPQWLFLLGGEREPAEVQPQVDEAAEAARLAALAEQEAKERAARERAEQDQREATLAREIFLKANAEFIAGNLGSAADILETVPEHESIAEDREELTKKIADIHQWMRSGRAAEQRGECERAIALFNRVLGVNPRIQEALNRRAACRQMLPPSFAD